MRIVFAGTPQFALPALHALIASAHEVVGVVTQPDRPRGRGRLTQPSPVKQAALDAGLALMQPARLTGDGEDHARLRAWQPDALVVVAYGLLLPQPVLALPRLGSLNIHPSLLPRWRGAAPIQRALLAGDSVTGVTIMQMDAGMDTGPILLQRSLPIPGDATAATLHETLAAAGAALLLEALEGLAGGTLQTRPQPRQGVTHAAKLDKAEALIDWTATAAQIERQVRALDPWPVAQTRFEGSVLRILAARVPTGPFPAGTPGEIVAAGGDALVVRCGQGCLGITRLQRPGRNPVSARDFAHTAALTGRRFG